MNNSDSDSDSDVERGERHFKERVNFELLENEVVERFRVNEDIIDFLLEAIGDQLQHNTNRNCALSSRQQILLCLRFLAGNSYYNLMGDAHGVHKSTVCRTIRSVVTAINATIYNNLVRFPENHTAVHQQFFAMYNMPSVV